MLVKIGDNVQASSLGGDRVLYAGKFGKVESINEKGIFVRIQTGYADIPTVLVRYNHNELIVCNSPHHSCY